MKKKFRKINDFPVMFLKITILRKTQVTENSQFPERRLIHFTNSCKESKGMKLNVF